jgi:hypothetical protein
LTERNQWIAEGPKIEKHMFFIFAAQMLELRVLQAYWEKVAREKRMKLLRELKGEDKAAAERKAKKTK